MLCRRKVLSNSKIWNTKRKRRRKAKINEERKKEQVNKNGIIFVRYDFNDNFDWFNNYNFSDLAIISAICEHIIFGMYACARSRFPHDCNHSKQMVWRYFFFSLKARNVNSRQFITTSKRAHTKRAVCIRTVYAWICMRSLNHCIATPFVIFRNRRIFS